MLVIDSNPKNVLKVESYLKIVKSEYGQLSDRYPDILISLTEAVNNAIIHGNKADESKKVKIECEEETTGLTFTISDEGNGFNPKEVPDPTHEDNLECCGGRGVFIMSQLADKVFFKNNGSRVEMFFNLGV